MDLSALHRGTGGNTDSLDNDDEIDAVVPRAENNDLEDPRQEGEESDEADQESIHTLEDDDSISDPEDYESVDTNVETDAGSEGDLPDLEDNSPLLRPHVTDNRIIDAAIDVSVQTDTRDENERECWVCFLSESETPGTEWVRPCRCDGSVGYVHQDCVKRWVEEKQKSNINSEVECPQCQTKYRFVFPKVNSGFKLMILGEQLVETCVTFCTIGGVIYGIKLVTVFYSRNVMKCMVADNMNFLGDLECRTLEPYREILMDNISDALQCLNYRIPDVFPFEALNTCIRHMSVTGQIFIGLFDLRPWLIWTWPYDFIRETIISFSIPLTLYNFRKINWDEPLLRKLDEIQNIKSRYEPVISTGKSTRRLIGGLVMPFAARILGDYIYGDSYSPGKRFIFGAFTYLFGKGAISFIRKYKFRHWLRARKVKGFKEGGEHQDENAVPQLPLPFQFEVQFN